MRTFKLQVQTSIDGYMAGLHGELDWLSMPWSDDLNDFVTALTEPVDSIVLGRNLAEGFIPAWANMTEGEDQASIDKMNNTPKVVISNSLRESPWPNATVAGGDLATTVRQLKDQEGGDLIAYGGGTLVRALIAAGLLNDLYLFVNPTAIGAGMAVFPDTGARQSYRLVNARPFECGITVLHYQPDRA